MQRKGLNPRILYLTRLLIKIEGEIRSFTDKKGLREFITTKPAMQEMLKGLASIALRPCQQPCEELPPGTARGSSSCCRGHVQSKQTLTRDHTGTNRHDTLGSSHHTTTMKGASAILCLYQVQPLPPTKGEANACNHMWSSHSP
ncbi:hypothetical protein QTO34_017061 [Cnephaeus nilssonii]|uniref:L1 transposable element dsRBD-like domain-containing protein n=1 Tax=Cnephaeus nilssonii TaxID=3371016 RepID=A0AA40I148_CNENI|nr:hypothetical protein QTO34_017061 [Eptesicus nilssonii]